MSAGGLAELNRWAQSFDAVSRLFFIDDNAILAQLSSGMGSEATFRYVSIDLTGKVDFVVNNASQILAWDPTSSRFLGPLLKYVLG